MIALANNVVKLAVPISARALEPDGRNTFSKNLILFAFEADFSNAENGSSYSPNFNNPR